MPRQRRIVNQPARAVLTGWRRLTLRQRGGIDHSPVLLRQGAMKGQHIGLPEQIVKFSNTFTSRRDRFRIGIVSQNLHTKGAGNLRHPAANGARPMSPSVLPSSSSDLCVDLSQCPFTQAAVEQNDRLSTGQN